jgi:ribosomal protein S18 acetylase RimI-like enzyme
MRLACANAHAKFPRSDFVMRPIIRRALKSDIEQIQLVVYQAYKHYVPRIGKAPAPMTDDYDLQIRQRNVWVLLVGAELVGVVVLKRETDHLLLDNVAVKPEHQGSGFGRLLIQFAENRARQCGYKEIQLYTNSAMRENIAMYVKLGYEEFFRGCQSGFHRVFLKKNLG